MDLPRILARRYRLDRRVSVGSDADTYLATDLALDRPVVVDVLRAPVTGDPAADRRFAHELRAAAAVDHPGVVRVLDAGSDGDTRFIVMEAVFGSSLKARLEAAAPLSIGQALGLTTQILGGLAAIHEAGIIHGGLTPENVLIDAQGRVKLTGFGIAHRAAGAERGEPPSPDGDVYAASVILFELLTGRPPSVCAGDDAVAALPAVLDGIVARALAEDPRQRYPSARAMQGVLEAVAAVQAIRVPPASRRESPRLAAARRGTARFLVTAAIVVLLLLTSLVVLAFRRHEPGSDLAAGPALASSQLVGPQPRQSAFGPATPTPTAATATPNLVPPPLHRIVPAIPATPVTPTPTAPTHPAARAIATAAPTPSPAPTPAPTPAIVRHRTPEPATTPIAESHPAAVPPAATPLPPHHHAEAQGRPGPPPLAPPGKATGQQGSPSQAKLPRAVSSNQSAPSSNQPNGHDGPGLGGSHHGKAGHAPPKG